MKGILKIFLTGSLISVLALTSCGGSDNGNSSNDEYGYEESSSRGKSSLVLNTPFDVQSALSNQTFKNDKGETLSFGSQASSVEYNGKPFGHAVQVQQIGKDDDGAPYAIFSFSSPYFTYDATFMLTEAYGKIMIIDASNPEEIFYKR